MSDYISDSLKKFQEKKCNCLEYIDEVETVYNEYLKEFPDSNGEVLDTNSHKSSSSELGNFEVGGFIDQLNILRNKISTETLKLMIAGQFKAGKSTSLNAILECDVLPAYSTPCTAVITEIHYAEKPKAEIEFKSDIQVIPDDLYDKAADHINKYMPNVPPITIEAKGSTPEDINEFKNDLENYLVIPMSDKEQEDSVIESPYKLCKLYWPLELFKDGVVIIDSPGLNENQARTDTTLGYLCEADMIIHVLSALQCYGQADKDFVKQVKVVSSETPLLFMVNRFDQLNTDRERERMKEYVRKNVSPQCTYNNEGVFFLSAQNALHGKLKNNDDELNSSGFIDFEKKVADIINRERGKIKLGNVKVLNEKLNSIITDEIPNLKVLLSNSAEELARKFKQNENEFKHLDEIIERIEKTVYYVVSKIEYDVKNSIEREISDFISRDLEKVINETKGIEINFWGKEESIRKSKDKLCNAVEKKLNDFLINWSKNELPNIINNQLNEFTNQIEIDMRRFSEGLTVIRNNFNLLCPSLSMTLCGLEVSTTVGAGLSGGVWGGVVGGIVAFAARQFSFVLGGPAGVAIGIGTAVLSAINAMINHEDAAIAYKKKVLPLFRNFLQEQKHKISKQISADVKCQFSSKALELVGKQKEEINKIKNPIIKALEQIKTEEDVRKTKAEKLEFYIKRLTETLNKGENLVSAL